MVPESFERLEEVPLHDFTCRRGEQRGEFSERSGMARGLMELTAATCAMFHRAVHVMEALVVAVHLAQCAVAIMMT